MEIMYWTFPHVGGKWSVSPKSSTQLVQGDHIYLVKRWANGAPVVGGASLDDAYEEFRGTRWVEGPAVQRGVLTDPDPVWKTQVGGQHYTDMKIQPFQFSMANNLDPMQHTIVKYVTRFRAKNGLQDLEKAKQTIDLLIAYEKEQGRG